MGKFLILHKRKAPRFRVLYNKSISKIDIVQSIAKEVLIPLVISYFL